MATKYSFHVRKQSKKSEQKSPRADFSDNRIDLVHGQTIILPTKGCKFHFINHSLSQLDPGDCILILPRFMFAVSAHATKCLPQASEIEVETGPYFGGRIVAESGNDCSIDGDPLSEQDRYVMRIDHEKCGSKVNHDTLTVETFITVQENIGIFTHSTRR